MDGDCCKFEAFEMCLIRAFTVKMMSNVFKINIRIRIRRLDEFIQKILSSKKRNNMHLSISYFESTNILRKINID